MIRRVLLGLLAAGVLLLLGLGLLTSTETGLRLLWGQVQPMLPIAVQLESLQGSLSGRLVLRGVRIEHESLRIELDQLRLHWSPRRLWSGELHVRELSLEALTYTELAPPVASTQPFELPDTIDVPLALRVDAFAANRISYRGFGAAEPFDVDSVQARLRLGRSRLEIERLALDAPLFSASVQGEVGNGNGFPLRADADWTVRPEAYPPLQGHTRAEGNVEQLVVQQTLQPPYAASLRATLHDVIDDLRFDAEATLQAIALQDLGEAAPPLTLAGRLATRGSLRQLQLDGDIDVNGTGQLQLRATKSPHDIEATLQWRDLAWPGRAEFGASRSGLAHISGGLDDYRVSVQGEVEVPAFTPVQLRLSGQGDRRALRIDELVLKLLGGEVSGNARIGWDPMPGGEVQLDARDLNPGLVLEAWPGQLDAALRANFTVPEAGPNVRVSELNAWGRLRGYPVELQAQGDYAPAGLTLDSLKLDSGASSLRVKGAVNDRLDLDWTLRSADLASLLPGAGGRLEGHGSARGALREPWLTARLDGSALLYRDIRLEQLSLDADVDVAGERSSSLDLLLGAGRYAATRIERVSLKGRGRPQAHTLTLDATADPGQVELTVKGRLDAALWHIDIEQGRVQYAAMPAWHLREAHTGVVGAEQAQLQRGCWTSGAARLCAEGQWSAAQTRASVQLSDFSLQAFEPLLAGDLLLEGSLGGTADVRIEAGRPPQITARLSSSAGRLMNRLEPAPEGDAQQGVQRRVASLLAFAPGSLQLDVSQTGLRMAARLPLQPAGGLELDAQVGPGDAPLVQRPLDGRLQTDVQDLQFLSQLIPALSAVSGRLEGDARASGTLENPAFTGDLALQDGSATLDDAGLTLENLQAQLSGAGDGRIHMRLSADSGGGTLTLSGESTLAAQAHRANFRIEGEAFKLLDVPQARVYVSPSLQLAIEDRDITVRGEVRVPEAKIEPRTLPASAHSASSDQILVDDVETGAAPDAYRISSRVRLILGDRVEFDGFGLSGRFTGNLLTIDEPMKPPTASGEISILDGRYRAYGQNLSIRRGRLLFVGGPLAEPGIDVEAIRTPAPDILVGVRVRGQFREPDISVFSEPAMSQSDQIAWLVLGRALESESTAQERNAVNRAAIAMGIGGGALLGKEFGEKIGFDELTVESGPGEDVEQAALLVGKYFTPKLYISYGIGLFDPVSTLRLRYTLSSRWKLLGETSATATGADIFYVIETGE